MTVHRDLHLPGWTDADYPALWGDWRPRSAWSVGVPPRLPLGAPQRQAPRQAQGRPFTMPQYRGRKPL
jgi:hypothetical protein